MSNNVDVLVIGGGVVGLASAIAMSMRGWSVAVLDKGMLHGRQERVYALNRASETLLTQLGVWQLLPPDAITPYQRMHIWDIHQQTHLDFDSRTLGCCALGAIVTDHELQKALLFRSEELSVSLHRQANVIDYTETSRGVRITTAAGDQWEAKLCMITDGANSGMRALLKIPVTTWSYHHDALVATVETEKPHQNTAYQVFTPDGPLAFLPLRQAHQCAIVWSHPPERIQALMTLDVPHFEETLATTFSAKLGRNRLVSDRVSFPLRMRHVKQYVGPAWMVLGDAAHTIHPLAGLGLNVGLADLSTWLNLLDADKSRVWSPRLLAAYQRERKHAVWTVIALMQGIKALFGISAKPVVMIRGIGMRLLNQVSPLKRLLMTYAAGEYRL